MKRITITLTEDQAYRLRGLLEDEITTLNFKMQESKTPLYEVDRQQAFLKRILNTLAKEIYEQIYIKS